MSSTDIMTHFSLGYWRSIMLESLWTMRCQCFQSEGELMLSRSLVYVICNVTCKVLWRSQTCHVKVTCNCCILLCLKHLIIIILFYSFVYRKFYQTVKKRVDTYFKENNIVCRYQRRIILGKHVYSVMYCKYM